MNIELNGPEYLGAPYPKFNAKKVNESAFEFELRAKHWDIEMKDNMHGNVKWLSQECDDPSDEWEKEIVRAFKANGFKAGGTIHVEFGSRDYGYVHDYVLTA